jgi:hypothetical protein
LSPTPSPTPSVVTARGSSTLTESSSDGRPLVKTSVIVCHRQSTTMTVGTVSI